MNEKKPKIRFKQFNGGWNTHTLKDFGKATGGTSIESEFIEDGKYKVISIGSYSEDSKYNDQNIRAKVSNKTKKRLLNKGDLTMLLNDKTASGRIIGRTLLIEKSNIYVYNQRTQRIEPNQEIYYPNFLYQLLNAPNIRKKIIQKSQGNTQIFVNWSNIQDIEYNIPKKEEQIIIGEFFDNIDNIITAQKHKYNKIVKLKKSMLEKMFPKNGNNIPEIRLKEFSEAWEQRKLEELYNFRYGEFNTNPSNGGPYPVYGANGIIGGYTNFNSEDAVIIGHMGEYAGSVLYAEGKHFVTYNGTIARPNSNIINPKFGYYMLLHKNINKICSGSGLPFLSYAQLNKIEVLFPKDIKEQIKICEYMSTLDNLITLNKSKLEKLQKLKKSLLDKMLI